MSTYSVLDQEYSFLFILVQSMENIFLGWNVVLALSGIPKFYDNVHVLFLRLEKLFLVKFGAKYPNYVIMLVILSCSFLDWK